MTHLFILSSHSSVRIRQPYRLFTLAKSHLNMPPLSICRCQKNESSSFLALFSLRFLCFFKKRIALSAECVSVRQRCCVCARLLSSCSILCPGNCFQHSQTHRKYPPALLYRFLIRRQDNRWRERDEKGKRGGENKYTNK